jgi:hypothetical protein
MRVTLLEPELELITSTESIVKFFMLIVTNSSTMLMAKVLFKLTLSKAAASLGFT